MDDMVLLKRRQDEFRAGYANWRMGGLKGARGEVGKGASLGDGATGEAGFRAGNLNWRKGGAAGARDSGMAADKTTMNVALMTETQASEAAAKGESWVRFFLHPDSDFYRGMSGGLQSYPLKAANLPSIARAQLQGGKNNASPLPTYARAVAGFDGVLCHIGVGGFHRSHQAVYTHQLLLDQELDPTVGSGERWGFVGIALMPWDKAMADTLRKQDGLYTVMGRDLTETTGMVVGSVLDIVYGPDDPTGLSVIERLAHPQTRIVSLTITEKGYCLDVDNRLDLGNPLVAHDLAHRGERPQSAVGTIAAALAVRRLRGLKPFTVLSCDNLPGNGTLARSMVLAYLEAFGDVALAAWTEAHCPFPNTMVDRITPATRSPPPPGKGADEFSDGIRTLVRETVGVEDDWPVIAETYMQWVVEDKFACGRPAWEARGVLFVPDVHPYEMMKLRLLNAGHSAISYASYLMGHRYVDTAMDPASLGDEPNPVKDFCIAFFEEQGPTVPAVPGVDTEDYKAQLVKRFSNPYIKDTLQRLAEDGSMKLVTTMRDACVENARAGRSSPLFAFVVAAWVRYLVGFDEQGAPIEIKDPRAAELTPMARKVLGFREGAAGAAGGVAVSAPTEPPVALLRAVFGDELAGNAATCQAVMDALTELVGTSTKELMAKVVARSRA